MQIQNDYAFKRRLTNPYLSPIVYVCLSSAAIEISRGAAVPQLKLSQFGFSYRTYNGK